MVALATALVAGAFAASATASAGSARPATHSERAAIMRALAANDANSSGVSGVYVSRSTPALAVVCERTPEAGIQVYVFGHSHGAWRYLTSGYRGHAGNSAQRHLELACH